jgi:hypothetical protein
MIRRLVAFVAFVAIVAAMGLIATVAVADKRHKTEALRHAHRTAWLCTHGRGSCGTLSDQIHRANIESDWNRRERYYVTGVTLGLIVCGVLIGFEVRSRRRPVGPPV